MKNNIGLKNFLDGLAYFKIGKKTFGIGKEVPYLFEMSSSIIQKNRLKKGALDKIKKDFSLLKDFGYIRGCMNPERDPATRHFLSLHVSHTCNMACTYCFGGDGTYGSKVRMMSPETARKAVRFFFDCNRNSKSRNLEIIFVGGEVLLNLPAIKAAVDEVRRFPEYDVNLKIITNGTILNQEIIGFLRKNRIEVAVSYDGKEHDSHRRFKNGRPTSKIVRKNINSLIKNRVKVIAIKACMAKDNPYSFTDVVRDLERLPIHPRRIRLSHEADFPSRLLRRDMYEQELGFFENIKKLVWQGKKLKDLPLNGREHWLDIFVQARKQPLQFCGFEHNNFAVVPNGDIYFCDLSINKKEFLFGNIHTGFNDKKVKRFMSYYVLKFPEECKDCYLKGICSYHCMYTRKNKTLLPKKCAFTKERFKTLLQIFLKLKPSDIASIYYWVRPEVRQKLLKTISSGYKLRSILYEKTTYLKPVNILPQHEKSKGPV